MALTLTNKTLLPTNPPQPLSPSAFLKLLRAPSWRIPCHSLENLRGPLENISIELGTIPSPKTMIMCRHLQWHPLYPGTLIEGDQE